MKRNRPIIDIACGTHMKGKEMLTTETLVGYESERKELMIYAKTIMEADRHRKEYPNLLLPHGVMVIGDHGMGKTTMVKETLGKGIPFLRIASRKECLSYLERKMMSRTRSEYCNIVFFDDLDLWLGQGNDPETITMRDQLLSLIEESKDTKDYFVASCTNVRLLDPAFFSPVRFGRKIVLHRPDENVRSAIFENAMNKLNPFCFVYSTALKEKTEGLSCGDMEMLANTVFLETIVENGNAYSPEFGQQVIDKWLKQEKEVCQEYDRVLNLEKSFCEV